MSKVERKPDEILEILHNFEFRCMNTIDEKRDFERVRQFVIQVQEAIKAIENKEPYEDWGRYEDGFDDMKAFALNKLKALGEETA